MSNFKRYYKDKNIVFITIVTYNRIPILIDNIEFLRLAFKYTLKKYQFQVN